MLKQDAALKLYMVGHTDNVGALAGNVELSRARAAAVVRELTAHYGIAAARLLPFGDGPYAPVTSNDSEDRAGTEPARGSGEAIMRKSIPLA